ncbi:MAG TPA: hypothetical protein GX745_04320 [Clostridiales bacterium]|jgi:NADH:ubiquinone oxidoreductase subunit 2 (subunit N)|nr:hypothetical protein [Clostridiales bacterium]
MIKLPIFSSIKDSALNIKKKIRKFRLISGLVILALSVLMILIEVLVLKDSLFKDAAQSPKFMIFAAVSLALRLVTIIYAFCFLVISARIKNKALKHSLYAILILLKIINVLTIFGWGSANNIIRGLLGLIPIIISCYALIASVAFGKMTDYLKKHLTELKDQIITKKGNNANEI